MAGFESVPQLERASILQLGHRQCNLLYKGRLQSKQTEGYGGSMVNGQASSVGGRQVGSVKSSRAVSSAATGDKWGLSSLNGRHAVVLGGAGFLGSHLVRRLRSEGARVMAIIEAAYRAARNGTVETV